MNIIEALSRDLNITNKQVESAISLINEGNTLAFIARYRKELTGSLSDEVLRELNKKYVYYKSINERAKTILDSMEAQGVLTDELKDQIPVYIYRDFAKWKVKQIGWSFSLDYGKTRY